MKKISKIIAEVVAIVLIIGLLLFVNALTGNPVSKMLAENSAKKYVNENYSKLDLVVEKTNYNFKFGYYLVFFRSSKSYDTAFSVYTNSFGKIIRDDYENEVANNFTTWRRLDSELRQIGKNLITENLPYNITSAAFLSVNDDSNDYRKNLTKDMKLDIHNPPFDIAASITIQDTDVSYEKLAEVLKALAKLCADNNIKISKYNIFIENDVLVSKIYGNKAREHKKLGDYNIPADLLNTDNLADTLKKYIEDKK